MERAKSGYSWRPFSPERALDELQRLRIVTVYPGIIPETDMARAALDKYHGENNFVVRIQPTGQVASCPRYGTTVPPVSCIREEERECLTDER